MLLEGQTDDTSDAEDLAALRGAADGAPAADKEPDGPAVPPAPEPGKSVSVEAPKSRRQRAEEERKAELTRMSETIKELRERDSVRDRQLGELTGHLSALAQQRAAAPPVQAYQPPPPQIPDPRDLRRQALKALDARDMDQYHELLEQANTAATMRAIAPALQRVAQQPQAPVQQQVPAELMAYFAAYPDVATHPSRDKLLMAKNAELEALGYPEGPGRVKAVFDHVQATVKAGKGAQRQAPGFDPSSAAALSGTPTARPAGGSSGPGKGEPRVELNAEERRMWKAAGFTDETELARYVAQSNPGRVLR